MKLLSWSLLFAHAHAFWSTCETGTTCVFYCYDKLLPKLYGAGPHLHVNPFCTMYGERTTPQDDVVAGNGRPPIKAQTKDRQDVFYDSVIITNLVPKEHLLKLLEHAAENPYKRNGKNLDYRLIYMEAVTIIREISAEFTGAELKFTKYAELDGMIQERLQAAQNNREELMHLSDANSGLRILKVTLSIPRLAEDVENKFAQEAAAAASVKAEEGIRRAALMAQETENQVAFLKAEKNRNVSAIQSQEAIEKKRANATEFEIQYMSELNATKAKADGEYYMLERKSEGLAKLGVNGELYVALVGVEAYNKIETAAYFGEPAAIPKMMVNGIGQGALGLPIETRSRGTGAQLSP